MRVKDIKTDLVGTKVTIPKKFEDKYMGIFGKMYIYSYWGKGIWFKKSMKEDRIYPLTMDTKELLNFVVVKERL
jgi:hypothetical protein